ncbi:hypothetical protein TNCV_5092851 [Trichonephila clavipes]|nr:hypothetical protein TNCV_5092851 [Trichonephila clavipes]
MSSRDRASIVEDNPNNVGVWEREVTELKIFNLKIDDSRHGVVPIMCAVSKRLANDMLVCSSAYEALLENVQFIHNPQTSTYLQGQLKVLLQMIRNQFPAKK